MSIDIITNEVTLSNDQIDKVNNFVKNNCSYYFFLNFIKITNGNVDDAIMLYHFDEELRNIILKYILRLEVQMKKDYVDSVEKIYGSSSFWNDPNVYNPAFTSINPPDTLSKFDITIKAVDSLMKNMNFSGAGPDNNRALYCSTMGSFIKMIDNILQRYKNDFNDKYIGYIRNSSKELHKYLNCLKKLRNRCCHSNHIVSIKFRNELSGTSLYRLSPLHLTNFEMVLFFIYRNLDNRKSFKSDILEILNKYKQYWDPYIGKHILNKDTTTNINNF